MQSRPTLARKATPVPTEGDAKIGKGERKILTACAQHTGGCTRQQLTTLTGYKRSTRDAYIQRLRVAGYVDDGNRIVATDAGIEWLGDDFAPLPTGAALLAHWMRELPEGERACLEVAASVYPEPTDREAISAATGYKRSTRDAYLHRLGSRQLVRDIGHGQVQASVELFG